MAISGALRRLALTDLGNPAAVSLIVVCVFVCSVNASDCNDGRKINSAINYSITTLSLIHI